MHRKRKTNRTARYSALQHNVLDVYSLSILFMYNIIEEDRAADAFADTDVIDAIEIGKKGDLKPLTELMFKHTSLVRPLETNYSKGHVEFVDFK